MRPRRGTGAGNTGAIAESSRLDMLVDTPKDSPESALYSALTSPIIHPSAYPMIFEHDIVVIGGGMAGAAVAAHLSEHASVRLLEMEHQPGYHSTGRSAALFAESYGNALVRALTRASRSFF